MLSPTNGLLEGKKSPEDLNKGNAINWNVKRDKLTEKLINRKVFLFYFKLDFQFHQKNWIMWIIYLSFSATAWQKYTIFILQCNANDMNCEIVIGDVSHSWRVSLFTLALRLNICISLQIFRWRRTVWGWCALSWHNVIIDDNLFLAIKFRV